MNISDMFDSLNEQLDQLRPDPSSAVTPPLSPCWINASSESGQEDNTGDIWSTVMLQITKHLAKLFLLMIMCRAFLRKNVIIY